MRRSACILLIIWMMLTLIGCKQSNVPPIAPADFYYRIPSGTHSKSDQVIASEQRESAGCENDLTALIERYLEGPISNDLSSAIPSNAYVLDVTQEDGTIIIDMSPTFARLTGIDLTIACSCLSMTLLSYTDAEEVEIRVPNALLDGNQSIVIGRDGGLLLADNMDVTKETQE